MKNKIIISLLGILSLITFNACRMNPTTSSTGTMPTTLTAPNSMNSNSTGSQTTYEGEYKETSFGTEYVTKVRVSVKGNTIEKVELLPGSNICTNVETWSSNNMWLDNEQKALDSYKGKTVEEVKGATTLPVDNVAGATLSSNRLFKAIQNALNK